MNSNKLMAELLFPNIKTHITDLETRFPRRKDTALEFDDIINRHDKIVIKGYEVEVIEDEIWITEKVNNLLFKKNNQLENVSESQDTDEWYENFDGFASLINHPKSLVRNRVLYILAANAQWDDENRFDSIISDFLTHVTDEN